MRESAGQAGEPRHRRGHRASRQVGCGVEGVGGERQRPGGTRAGFGWAGGARAGPGQRAAHDNEGARRAGPRAGREREAVGLAGALVGFLGARRVRVGATVQRRDHPLEELYVKRDLKVQQLLHDQRADPAAPPRSRPPPRNLARHRRRFVATEGRRRPKVRPASERASRRKPASIRLSKRLWGTGEWAEPLRAWADMGTGPLWVGPRRWG